MSNPKTQEYLEAEQAEATNRKDKIINELSAEDKKKFEIVEKVVKELTDNKINFHLYSLLPNSWYNNKDVIWQYNSLTALANFDNAGKISPESNANIAKFCAGMLTCIFNDVTSFKLGKDAPFKDRWECFGEYLQSCLSQYYGYLDENDSRLKNAIKTPKNNETLPEESEEDELDLDECEQCGENAWDGRICHSCGAKNI